MSESMALVGLDVHQAQTVATLLDQSTGELRVERLRGEPASVVPVFLEELDRPVTAVYEAGPTGFAGAWVRLGVKGSPGQLDRDAGAAEIDEGDERRGGVKAEAAV